MKQFNLFNILIPLTMLSLLSSCVSHNNGKKDELYYPVDSISSATSIDSTMSDDGNLKIYTISFPSEGLFRDYSTVIVYRTPDGTQHVDKRPVFDIANKTNYGCYIPVIQIFQSTSNDDVLYIIELDDFGGTAHDNSMLVAMHISGDSIETVPIFRCESTDTCLAVPRPRYQEI